MIIDICAFIVDKCVCVAQIVFPVSCQALSKTTTTTTTILMHIQVILKNIKLEKQYFQKLSNSTLPITILQTLSN